MQRHLLTAALALSSALVAGSTAWVLAPGGRAAPPAPPAPLAAAPALLATAEVAALRTEVAQLAAALRSASLAAPSARAEAGGERASGTLGAELARASETVADLRAELDGLRADLERRRRELGALARVAVASGGPPLYEVLAQRPDPDWSALEALASREARQRGAALADVRFLGPRELLERFGPPTLVAGDGDGATRWEYSRERGARVGLGLRDGYVVTCVVRWSRP